ncbi:MAG: 1,6-anhydro-N-acetylmuramyl-L-alanine amidase AmpD [Gammaproteobacteria bacterium]|nr:1,6-anhydro-N-acetylmuramyl-L-alanine amidase AmpD [Gammaproteobacteria bacterium]NIR85274.1 1,6-anhydro-N-acetylmuramyl-L-alanine amidase AmpD [Gammaproteobacteria bacterium]NIR88390.1 1,6-anhydro-N-acetylmuramyl-L-alanine amidase AmpD [Gammaproteobacteria bacterium]NIU06340.1 1,6-anhydro-N-acetylmuramyl-L-alanine amidase AmpD [Gammaproteobacteria bacterium]NIV53239.1 1,6-anhydro-N-acetylmuramyl-L-alanine amidase AmpD [Gammaproteobacteria bacterium]
MNLDTQNDWLEGVRRVPSPNWDERPPECDIDLLVVHSISLPPGVYGGGAIDALFTNQLDASAHPYFESIADMRVSAHALIRRDGEVVQYVPFRRRAWHAGASSYRGRSRCNDFSIGIELEGTDDDAYEVVQYHRLAELARLLMRAWPAITVDRIVGHSDIASERKTDPGSGFDWVRFHALLGVPSKRTQGREH